MRGVRFTKAELGAIRVGLVLARGTAGQKAIESAEAKLFGAEQSEALGANAGSLERALIAQAMGKVVPTVGSGYARASKIATAGRVTEDQMAVVGSWLARQKWLTEPVTILTVLNKWSEWYPRAKAVANPGGLNEGLGGQGNPGDLRSGASSGGSTAPKGRTTPGFGR